ncbi:MULTISPECIES: hypothetical protein [Virgibacillus]|uniref:Uncharacterized protein n=2 Tax=Virgibacillus TaxID=84406 RepID=A0A024QDI7_9BACI|nr:MULTISPECIES: hypothetical protein [Virgibacillus]EQB35303.1 hypothetical protein M948_19580 [Virgibacillus sp. CM-4]MYL42667.1 hypothetical protein [Virgibacillus massiliensis]GGJ75918.1 hypothetical protein GCM10007111_41800 [Virgibacillus kapii]CDQ40554.1 hypothetical protein BN990_02879 [Virgibacillus massiliensis]
MFKKSLRFSLIYFAILTLWQLFENKKVNWFDNIGIGFTMFLILLFYNWSKVPYKWKKRKEE